MSSQPHSSLLISAHEICLKIQDRWVLDKVSLRLHEGEFLTLVGPNGAGKTTLLRVLLGAINPTHGHVECASHLRVGYLPQRLQTEAAMPMRVREFLKLNQKFTPEAWEEVVALTQIENLLASSLGGLSGGEMQRVLLARALLRNPNLLVLDEPAQNLDIHGQLAFYELLDKVVAARRCAVLMVSHDLHVVLARSNRVLCLYGHICCEGAPEAIVHHPDFQLHMGTKGAEILAVFPHRAHHQHPHETHEHTHVHVHGEGCNHG